MNYRNALRATLLLLLLALIPSCVKMTHQLEQSKPLEINVNVRLIDDRLDDFYAFEQKYRNGTGGATTQPAATQPAS